MDSEGITLSEVFPPQVLLAEQYGILPGQVQPTGAFRKLVDKAMAENKIISLNAGEYLFSDVIDISGISSGAKWGIIGQGPELTRIKLTAPTTGYFLELTGSKIEGATAVTWPSGDGTTFTTNYPTTYISTSVAPGQWTIEVPSTTWFNPGDLIALRSQRLFVNSDSRNSCMFGELNRIVEVSSSTELILEQVTQFGYQNMDSLWEGTLDGGSSSSIILPSTTGLNYNHIQGCRITITAGTGVGQVRYGNYVDADTYTMSIDVTTNRRQDPFDPAPDNTSVVKLDAPTYVYIIDNPYSVVLKDFTLDVRAAASTTGIYIGQSYRPLVDNVWIDGAESTILRTIECYQPTITSLDAREATSDSLGYGTVISSCRDAQDTWRHASKCRRGVDVTGGYPSINSLIDGYLVAQGGGVSFIGGSSGVGSHGGSYATTYRNGIVVGGDAMVGVIIRGVREVVDGLTILGPCRMAVSAYFGSELTVKNIQWNGADMATISPAIPIPPAEISAVVVVSPTFSGNVTVTDVNCDAAINALVYFSQEFSLPDNLRVTGDCVVQNVVVRNPIPGTFRVIDSDGDFIPFNFFLNYDTINVRMTGGGTYSPYSNLKLGNAGSPTVGTTIRMGGSTWIACILDATVTTIPCGSPFELLSVKIWDLTYNALTPVYFNGTLRDATTDNPVSWSTPSAQMEVLVAPFVIGGVGASKFAIGYDGDNLYLGNNLGRRVTVQVQF
jgi:hypothetical protein